MVLELQPVMQKIKIPSKSENIHLVEKLVDDVCAEVGVHEEKYGNMYLYFWNNSGLILIRIPLFSATKMRKNSLL